MIETCCLKNVVNFFAKNFKFCAIKKHYMTTILKTMTTAFFTSFYLLCEQNINISILTKLWTICYSINKLNRSSKIFPEFSLGVMIFQEIPEFSRFFLIFQIFQIFLWFSRLSLSPVNPNLCFSSCVYQCVTPLFL